MFKYGNPMLRYSLFLLISMSLFNCKKKQTDPVINTTPPDHPTTLPISKIKLPAGFRISVFAENVPGARSMAMGDKGTLFVGTRGDKVYALVDKNGDRWADTMFTIASGLHWPNGVAFKDGSLYVAEVNRIIRFDNAETALRNNMPYTVVSTAFPDIESHGWKYIAFGPDGKLYVPVGAPCNICDSNLSVFASIHRMDADGTNLEQYARGIRNTVGFDWHPVTHQLWFTDNGRDDMGDDLPADELNYAPTKGMNFGYPYCHQGDTPDPVYGSQHNCSEFTAPAIKLGPHVAALGMKFYTGTQFPIEYRNQAFIAEHGSWNRTDKIGYRISLVKVNNSSQALSYTTFAEGWLQNGTDVWGRPVDILVMKDGSILVSDDFANAIYRIRYQP